MCVWYDAERERSVEMGLRYATCISFLSSSLKKYLHITRTHHGAAIRDHEVQHADVGHTLGRGTLINDLNHMIHLHGMQKHSME